MCLQGAALDARCREGVQLLCCGVYTMRCCGLHLCLFPTSGPLVVQSRMCVRAFPCPQVPPATPWRWCSCATPHAAGGYKTWTGMQVGYLYLGLTQRMPKTDVVAP